MSWQEAVKHGAGYSPETLYLELQAARRRFQEVLAVGLAIGELKNYFHSDMLPPEGSHLL